MRKEKYGLSMSSFHASNNQYGNPPSMLHEIRRGKQEQTFLSQYLQPLLLHHSLFENTCSRWIHKYTYGEFFDVVDTDLNSTRRSTRLFVNTSSRDAQASHSSHWACIRRRRPPKKTSPAEQSSSRAVTEPKKVILRSSQFYIDCITQWSTTSCSGCSCRSLICAHKIKTKADG